MCPFLFSSHFYSIHHLQNLVMLMRKVVAADSSPQNSPFLRKPSPFPSSSPSPSLADTPICPCGKTMWGAGWRVGLNEMARVIVSVHIATKKRPFWRARCKCLRYFKNKILRSEKPPVFSNIRNRLTQRILQRRRHFSAAKR